MRKPLLWLGGGLIALACSVNPVETFDASGGAGRGGAGTTGQGGATAGTSGQAGASAGASGQAGTTGQAGRGGTSGSAGATGTAGTTGAAGRGGTTGTAGATGGAGRGGTTGAGGAGGTACTALETMYSAAITKAKMCSANASNQCQFLVSTSLSCPGCMTHVNDTGQISTLQIMYQQAGCNSMPHICPAIACVNPGTGACVVMNSGDVCN